MRGIRSKGNSRSLPCPSLVDRERDALDEEGALDDLLLLSSCSGVRPLARYAARCSQCPARDPGAENISS
jgi:hypothetical protein